MFKTYCVICKDKPRLEQTDSFMYICKICKRIYNLYYEVLAYEDTLESTHEEESSTLELAGLSASSGPGLVSAKDDNDNYPLLDEIMEEEQNKGKIAVPKYMKDGPVTTVEHFHEEID